MLRAIVIVSLLAVGAAPALGQSGTGTPAPADTARGQPLPPIVVTATVDRNPFHKLGRVRDAAALVVSLMRANHKLRGEVRREDRTIARLESQMASLHAQAERYVREIVALDSTTERIRTQRLRLEAQLDLADRLEERLVLAEQLAAQQTILFGRAR